jgi:hypothetical protein
VRRRWRFDPCPVIIQVRIVRGKEWSEHRNTHKGEEQQPSHRAERLARDKLRDLSPPTGAQAHRCERFFQDANISSRDPHYPPFRL